MTIKSKRFIDRYVFFILIIIVYILKTIKYFIKPKHKKVAIIRLWTLGESILTLPLIKKLNQEGYQVDVIAMDSSRPVFERTERINKIITFSPLLFFNLFHYDYVIDTEPNFNISAILAFLISKKSIGFSNMFRGILYDYKINYDDKKHSTINFSSLLSPLGINHVPDKLIPLNYTNNEKNKVDNIIKQYSDNLLVGIHYGLRKVSPHRIWKAENFANLIDRITNKYENIKVLITGSPSEYAVNNDLISLIKNKSNVINFAGKTSLGEFSYLMTKFKLFISSDTGPMHLAAAMGTKTIGLFGPNLPERFAPYGKGNISIYKSRSLNCSPCVNTHLAQFRKCPYKGRCMNLISVDTVFKEVEKIMK